MSSSSFRIERQQYRYEPNPKLIRNPASTALSTTSPVPITELACLTVSQILALIIGLLGNIY